MAGADEDRDRLRGRRAGRRRRTGRGGPRRLRLGRRRRLLLPRLPDRRLRRPAGGQDPGLARPASLTHDAHGLVVPGSGRTVAVLGLEDVVVVDTPDAVLVTTRARAQEVKALVERAEEQRPRRPHLTPRPVARHSCRWCPRPLGRAGWVVCRSCGPLLPHRRPELDRGRAGAGAGGGSTRPARAPRAGPHRDPDDHARRPPPRGRPGSGCARCRGRAWSPTSGPGTRRTAWPCARTWTRCRSWTGPACPGPRSTTGSATPAGTTSTPARCSAPGSRCGRTRSVGDLGVAVRLIFQPAEEVIPGGAHEVVAHGGLDGVDRDLRHPLRPGRRRGARGPARGPHHRRRRLGHRHPLRARVATPPGRT